MLTVKSQPGAGSTFCVYLPSAGDPDPVPQTPPAGQPVAAFRTTKTVLMVEDEASVRHVVQVMLERMGMNVIAATDAQDALRVMAMHRGDIDFLLTDVIMPGLNGRQLAEHVQAIRPNIRTIYMSGYTDDSVVQQVVLQADAFYIQKPFDAETLGRTLRQALEAAI
ncbi:MAG: response regulator [Vicinamibacterales bacterium]